MEYRHTYQFVLSLCIGAILLMLNACSPAPKTSVLEQVKRELCKKNIVLLGEGGSHGEGTTEAFKAELIPLLVKDCDFKLVVFEASFYEFAKIDQSLANGLTVERNEVAAAIGGLWRFDEEMQDLIDFLTSEANAGQIRLGGMDDQISGYGQDYANNRLFPELSDDLNPEYRKRCRTQFNRRVYGSHTDESPYTQNTRDALLKCLQDSLASRKTPSTDDERILTGFQYDQAKIESLTRFLDRDLKTWQEKTPGREASMFHNLLFWLKARNEPTPKTIIWTATVHAMKTDGSTNLPNFGDRVGDRVTDYFGPQETYILAISALRGSIRQNGTITELPEAPANALERLALEGIPEESVFVGTQDLEHFGVLPASLTGRTYSTYKWSEHVDGVVIFNKQRPPIRLKEAP